MNAVKAFLLWGVFFIAVAMPPTTLAQYVHIDHSLTYEQLDRSFLEPPVVIKNPEAIWDYLPENRTGTGIPSLAVSPEGKMWAVWYVGRTTTGRIVERCPYNYVVVASSTDGGLTWEEVLAIDPDIRGPIRAFDPQVWFDPDGRLWVFWAQEIMVQRSISNRKGECLGVWAITSGDADMPDPAWSEPKRLTDGIMTSKPVVLSTGEWVLPASTCMFTGESAKMVVSADRGNTWNVRGSVDVPDDVQNFDEHMIVERRDGSLWMLVRTLYGIGESTSTDRGYTWSPLVPSAIQHTTARFFITRLQSGNLLLVKHGPIDMRIKRTHLMAFVSRDDGKTWSRGLLLEKMRITYPDGQQVNDGTIHIVYDHGRNTEQLVFMMSFTEEDILSESDARIVKVHESRKIVSQGGVKPCDPSGTPRKLEGYY